MEHLFALSSSIRVNTYMRASMMQLLEEAADSGRVVEMENLFSRLTLDIIGKAVFDYDFDSLTHDDPVIQVTKQCHAADLSVSACWRQSYLPAQVKMAAARPPLGCMLSCTSR